MTALKHTLFLCLMAFLISNTLAKVAKESRESRIVGGTITTIDKAPYTLQLRMYNKQFCAAALVHPLYAISAAHCFVNTDKKNVEVVGGANTRTDEGVRRNIVQVFTHPEYSRNTMHSDIVVLKLDKSMVGKNIAPIPISTRPVKEGVIATVTGWGQTSTKGPMSESLRLVRVPVSSDVMCKKSYSGLVEKNMFCAFEAGSKDACGGDSGGPAVCNGQLCGVVSFGWECASLIHPGSYTDVYAVRSFIQSVMWK